MEKPVIAESDYMVLKNLLDKKNVSQLIAVGKQIKKATVVKDDLVPNETIRLNSHVEVFDTGLKRCQKIKIVMPDMVDLKNKWISVFAPLSVALLGRNAGDIVELHDDGFERRLEVVNVINHTT